MYNYCAMDKELVREREYAKKLCYEFNMTDPSNYDRRKSLLQKLFRTDKDCYVEPQFYCDYGYNIIIGKSFYANHNCVILDVNTVKFGNNVLLGPAVQVCTALHPLNHDERISGLEYGLPIEIAHMISTHTAFSVKRQMTSEALILHMADYTVADLRNIKEGVDYLWSQQTPCYADLGVIGSKK